MAFISNDNPSKTRLTRPPGSPTSISQPDYEVLVVDVLTINSSTNQVGKLAFNEVVTAITTVGAGTLTAAGIAGGTIARSGPTSAFTDTTGTAAAIIAAQSAAAINNSWLLKINNATAFVETIAAGSGVTLTGNIIVPPLSTGTFLVTYTGTGAVSIVGLTATPITTTLPVATTTLSTVGAGTMLAASIVGGLVTRTGSQSGTAFTDTTDTAALIIAAKPNAIIGQSWLLDVLNTTDALETIAGGSGVTMSGTTQIGPNGRATFLVTYNGTGTVTMNGLSSLAANRQFGASTAFMKPQGMVNVQVSATGVNTNATGADKVLAVYSIPASAFDGASGTFRGLKITAHGSFAANGNTKQVKLIFNPATAVVGSTVGASGTTLADTGAVTTSGGGWSVSGFVFKYGAATSNTQFCISNGAIAGAVSVGLSAPAAATATESGAILVAVTGNATTAATDILFNIFQVEAMN